MLHAGLEMPTNCQPLFACPLVLAVQALNGWATAPLAQQAAC